MCTRNPGQSKMVKNIRKVSSGEEATEKLTPYFLSEKTATIQCTAELGNC